MILQFEEATSKVCIDTTQIACVRTAMNNELNIILYSGKEMRLRCLQNRSAYELIVEAIVKDHMTAEQLKEYERQKAVDEKNASLRRGLDDYVELQYMTPRCQFAIETIVGKNPTYRDLLKHKRTEFLEFRNFGKKSLRDIDDIIEMAGLRWGMEE